MPLTNVKVSASEEPLSKAHYETDLSRCFICQEDKDLKLMCPSVQKEGAWFTTIAENLIQFEEIECFSFSLERLDE